MEKILKDDKKLVQKLANYFLKHQDHQRLFKLNLKAILPDDLDFAKKLLQLYLDEDNYSGVTMIVDTLAAIDSQPKTKPKKNKICYSERVPEMLRILRGILERKQLSSYRYGISKNVNFHYQFRIDSITYNPGIGPKMLECQEKSPDFIKTIYSDFQCQVSFVPNDGQGSEIKGCCFGCRRDTDEENEYTVCFLSNEGEFRFTTFNQDGEVIS